MLETELLEELVAKTKKRIKEADTCADDTEILEKYELEETISTSDPIFLDWVGQELQESICRYLEDASDEIVLESLKEELELDPVCIAEDFSRAENWKSLKKVARNYLKEIMS